MIGRHSFPNPQAQKSPLNRGAEYLALGTGNLSGLGLGRQGSGRHVPNVELWTGRSGGRKPAPERSPASQPGRSMARGGWLGGPLQRGFKRLQGGLLQADEPGGVLHSERHQSLAAEIVKAFPPGRAGIDLGSDEKIAIADSMPGDGVDRCALEFALEGHHFILLGGWGLFPMHLVSGHRHEKQGVRQNNFQKFSTAENKEVTRATFRLSVPILRGNPRENRALRL